MLNGIQHSYRSAGEIFVFNNSLYKHMLGHGNEIRPNSGDLCMVIKHSGDCFHTYAVLRAAGVGIDMRGIYKMVGTFGAYEFGKCVTKLGKMDRHMVQAGFNIRINF